ncbi:hypothetical protein DAEQUDRAFT_765543 [Daedalea quercina L-15889]|uniref:Uncharacterized protein n=1 Tax=Daedalea quercina L-15889 TaxID=1314783 RepID=A0A165QAH8_9APHY|nr:hypothetical protein DAEQUDRAFT_765543 [Daedalea quercina L-15889]
MPEATSPSAVTSQKRKARHSLEEAVPDASDAPRESSETPSDGSESRPAKNEYETGRVKCEGCGEEVSFRDESTGGFTLRLWEAHRLKCPNSSQPQIAQSLAQPAPTRQSADISFDPEPQAKRRRSKRTEEERIEYLRNDPYVAQFEAYRVLCACCDKWIRLRPNSTYCSIPWDAHRKSCLAKKAKYFPAGAQTVCDDRGAIFAADPNVRKFDSERVLCRNCEGWISIGVVDNQQASDIWQEHRASCQRNVFYGQGGGSTVTSVASNPAIQDVPPPSKHLLALASSSSFPPATALPINGAASSSTAGSSVPISHASSFKDYSPSNQEPRRRTAEQRAAQLRADPLVGEVEPTRVFCTMCHKWVQLRQDSTYCSYPWEQHRDKCMKRQQARSQKEGDPGRVSVHSATGSDIVMRMEGGSATGDADSEEGEESLDGGEKPLRWIPHREVNEMPQAASRPSARASVKPGGPRGSSSSTIDGSDVGGAWADRMDVDRPIARLADLHTPRGRLDYTFRSITHLFNSTYEPTDELTIASLVTYLNAAMPPDKHEDFDTAEVTKAAMALQARGQFVLEGDVLRIKS